MPRKTKKKVVKKKFKGNPILLFIFFLMGVVPGLIYWYMNLVEEEEIVEE